MSAIASVPLAGPDAHGILGRVFRAGKEMAKGSVVHGWIVDGDRMIDEIVIGFESDNEFVIHCHGNPLLLEQIVHLLQSHGAALAEANEFLFNKFRRNSSNAIEAEAKLAMRHSATLAGAKILQAQINGGLSTWARNLLENSGSIAIEEIHKQCKEILRRSQMAKRITEGVRIVIAGPPNSGKSTLLNCLAGQEQVIVSETAGTTRDWVSVTCFIDPLRIEFIDTAGLDNVLARRNDIERAAQGITNKLLSSCDLILYVQDILADSQPPAIHVGRAPIVSVYNKSDLVGEYTASKVKPRVPGKTAVSISAMDNIGIDSLAREIINVLGVRDFDINCPVAFTQRQHTLLSAIIDADHISEERLSDLLFSANGS